MKNPSLNVIYNKLNKHILLAQAFTENSNLAEIIRSCRLKPYDYFFKTKKPNIILYKYWFDEYGNTLSILKNKKLKITFNDLAINKSQVICTDLYCGLSIDKIIRISKLAFFFLGKDEDLYKDCFIMAFLGIDNYLRTYSLLYDEFKQISPLSLGLNNLNLIFKNSSINNFIKLENIKNMPIPCVSADTWLTSLPPREDFLEELKMRYETAFNICNFNKDSKI